MYQPDHFQIHDRKKLNGLIQDNALALLVMVNRGSLDANHIPVVLDEQEGEFGRLRFHLARANPLATALIEAEEILFVFQGEQAYVSPDWYGELKNMVPTWNYAVVHAHGRATELDDDGLVNVLTDLSAAQEKRLDKSPWTSKKMDQDVFAKMRRAIVGFQMPITRLHGKWKMSQNRPDSARLGVIRALDESGTENAVNTAQVMRELLG